LSCQGKIRLMIVFCRKKRRVSLLQKMQKRFSQRKKPSRCFSIAEKSNTLAVVNWLH
jgi:hypothetical protein